MSENTEQDFNQGISLGPAPHPITGELGIRLMVGEGSTWLKLVEALNLVTQLQSVVFTTIATQTFANIMHDARQASADAQLILPQ